MAYSQRLYCCMGNNKFMGKSMKVYGENTVICRQKLLFQDFICYDEKENIPKSLCMCCDVCSIVCECDECDSL